MIEWTRQKWLEVSNGAKNIEKEPLLKEDDIQEKSEPLRGRSLSKISKPPLLQESEKTNTFLESIKTFFGITPQYKRINASDETERAHLQSPKMEDTSKDKRETYLKHKINKLEKSFIDFKEKIDGYNDQIKILKSEEPDKLSKIDIHTRDVIEDLEGEVKKYEKHIEKNTNALNIRKAQLKELLTTKNNTIDALKENIKNTNFTVKSLQDLLSGNLYENEDRENIQNELNDLNKALNSDQEKLNRLTGDRPFNKSSPLPPSPKAVSPAKAESSKEQAAKLGEESDKYLNKRFEDAKQKRLQEANQPQPQVDKKFEQSLAKHEELLFSKEAKGTDKSSEVESPVAKARTFIEKENLEAANKTKTEAAHNEKYKNALEPGFLAKISQFFRNYFAPIARSNVVPVIDKSNIEDSPKVKAAREFIEKENLTAADKTKKSNIDAREKQVEFETKHLKFVSSHRPIKEPLNKEISNIDVAKLNEIDTQTNMAKPLQFVSSHRTHQEQMKKEIAAAIRAFESPLWTEKSEEELIRDKLGDIKEKMKVLISDDVKNFELIKEKMQVLQDQFYSEQKFEGAELKVEKDAFSKFLKNLPDNKDKFDKYEITTKYIEFRRGRKSGDIGDVKEKMQMLQNSYQQKFKGEELQAEVNAFKGFLKTTLVETREEMIGKYVDFRKDRIDLSVRNANLLPVIQEMAKIKIIFNDIGNKLKQFDKQFKSEMFKRKANLANNPDEIASFKEFINNSVAEKQKLEFDYLKARDRQGFLKVQKDVILGKDINLNLLIKNDGIQTDQFTQKINLLQNLINEKEIELKNIDRKLSIYKYNVNDEKMLSQQKDELENEINAFKNEINNTEKLLNEVLFVYRSEYELKGKHEEVFHAAIEATAKKDSEAYFKQINPDFFRQLSLLKTPEEIENLRKEFNSISINEKELAQKKEQIIALRKEIETLNEEEVLRMINQLKSGLENERSFDVDSGLEAAVLDEEDIQRNSILLKNYEKQLAMIGVLKEKLQKIENEANHGEAILNKRESLKQDLREVEALNIYPKVSQEKEILAPQVAIVPDKSDLLKQRKEEKTKLQEYIKSVGFSVEELQKNIATTNDNLVNAKLDHKIATKQGTNIEAAFARVEGHSTELLRLENTLKKLQESQARLKELEDLEKQNEQA